MRLFAFRKPKLPITGSPSTGAGSAGGAGQTGMGILQIGPSKPAARARSRTWSEWTIRPCSRARSSTSPASGKSSGRVDQSGGTQPSTTPSPSRRPGQAGVALHRVQVARDVLAREREPGDEVVQHEVVQHDDAGRPPQRVDDPAVHVGVVADVVDRERRSRAAASSARASGTTTSTRSCSAGSEQRAVVRDARALGRQRRVVGDLHPSSRSIAASQVTRSATALPARPHSCPSAGWSRR